jgi:hypothetical protein
MARTRPRTDPAVEVAGILPTQPRDTTRTPKIGTDSLTCACTAAGS